MHRASRRGAHGALLVVCLLASGAAGALAAQQPGGRADAPPPVAPAVMNRDEAGRTTVRAVRLAAGIRLDGVLDEEAYRAVPPITGFLQQAPVEGAPASERTEALDSVRRNERLRVGPRARVGAPRQGNAAGRRIRRRRQPNRPPPSKSKAGSEPNGSSDW